MKTFLPYIFIAGMVMAGCEKADSDDTTVDENKDAQVELTINGADLVDVMTRSYSLTDPEETQIKTLDVLVFNSSGNIVTRVKLTDPLINAPNKIITKSGSGMSVYVVANATTTIVGNGTPDDPLGMASNVNALKDIKITNMFVDIQNNRTLVMYGVRENVTINPDGSPITSIPITLNYVAAKFTVNIYSSMQNGDTFELVDWKIGDLARYSYIFPRSNDVVNVNNATDFVTQTSTNTWSDGVITANNVTIPVKTTTFYLFENRRATVSSITDAKNKSGTSAPTKATNLIARGYYKATTGVTGVDIKLMFGENSINNYDIKRGCKYTYNVNIKGIGDIDIDTRFDGDKIGYQAELSSPTLDAHYDFRPLRISAYKGKSVIQILNENGSAVVDPVNFWLKISPKNITKFILNSGVYTRPTYNPVSDMTLSTEVTNTDLNSITSEWAYLYADEYLAESGVRKAQVKVTYTSDGSNTPLGSTIINITQRGIQLAGNVGLRRVNNLDDIISTTQYKLGYDVINEEALSITPGNMANERTMTMQYGDFGGIQVILLDNAGRRNGFENTQALVFSNIATGTLRNPYGRTGTSAISYSDWDFIYNTYAARYCFEKNRDTDGNGKIEGPEIKWYLPSIEEQTLIYVGNKALSQSAADLWPSYAGAVSSTQYTLTNVMATFFPLGQSVPVSTTTVQQAVRCVRKM